MQNEVYPLPPSLKGKLSVAQYNVWLAQQAASIYNRDRRDFKNLKLKRRLHKTKKSLADILHREMMQSDGNDFYTGATLSWGAEKRRIIAKKKRMTPIGRVAMSNASATPTFDHFKGQDEPVFKLCGAMTNHAKCYMSNRQFIALCHAIVARHPI